MTDELTTEQVSGIALGVLDGWLSGYADLIDDDTWRQVQFRRMADGSWRVDPGDGPRGAGTLGTFRIMVRVERVDTPEHCAKCDYDRHRCPGCGADVPHGTIACAACRD